MTAATRARRGTRPMPARARRLGLGPILAIMLGAGAFRSPAPSNGHEPEPLRYEAGQLDCARFRERSRSEIETYVAGQARRETAGLDGEWRFRAASGPGDSVRVEAWFDTLSVWRRSEQDSLSPDTDGIIGGRYRGLLSGDGGYRAEARPFVPDPLQEVADLSRALDDLLPRLPPRPLGYGETWSDGAGLEIRRLADSAGAGEPIHRFSLVVRRKPDLARLRGDSLPLRVRQTIREDDTFAWHERAGLLRRDRRISVETYVPTEARVRRPVQARIEQRVVLERVKGGC